MRLTPARLLRAVLAGLAAALIVAATLWLNLRFGFGADLLGQPRAEAPTLPHSALSFARAALGAAAPLALPMAVLGALSGPWPIRAITLLVLAGGWYWAGDRLAMGFAGEFGAAWLPGEPFAEALFDPVLTPLALALALLGQAGLLKWLNRRAT
jgi:hypothetical protein